MWGWCHGCSGRKSRAFCITHPSDKWAEHELIQAGQKNSTFHRCHSCEWPTSTDHPGCFSQGETDRGNAFPHRSGAVLQKCTVQAVPSIASRLVEAVLLILRVFGVEVFSSQTFIRSSRLNVAKSPFKHIRILSRNTTNTSSVVLCCKGICRQSSQPLLFPLRPPPPLPLTSLPARQTEWAISEVSVIFKRIKQQYYLSIPNSN